MKIFKWMFLLISAIIIMGCYPNVKSQESVITKPDGQIDIFDEGNYIDNVTRSVNIVYSKSSKRYFVSTDDGLFDAFYTKEILENYYLLEGIKERNKPVNLYLVKLSQNKIKIYTFDIPHDKFERLQDKFNVLITFDKDEIFIKGESYNIFEFSKYCIKNNYIVSDFFLTRKLNNL